MPSSSAKITIAHGSVNSSSQNATQALHQAISNHGNTPTTISIVPEEEPDAHDDVDSELDLKAEARLVRKIDLRLCTISGILCSLNLLDSGIISSAAVTSMLSDLQLTGNRYSVSIFIFTV